MTMLRILLICFCAAIKIAIAAPARVVQMPAFSFIFNNNASSRSLASSLTPSSLSNSTANSFNPPTDPWVRETSAGGSVVLTDFGTATGISLYEWQAEIGVVLAQARAEAVGHTRLSSLPDKLDYIEEHAIFYVDWLLPGVTWSVWSAALEQITYFNRSWRDVTFYFRIFQPSGLVPGSVAQLVAFGQLRVI